MKYQLPNNRTLTLKQDDCLESPREWCNLGTMVCFHKGYDLGDKHDLTLSNAQALEMSDDVVALPLYLYDHSGITMNTTGFNCRWDSGQVGVIYVTKDDIRKEYGIKKVTKKWIEKIKGYLKNEVEVYDQYLTGDVYYFRIEKQETCNLGCEHSEIEDSCGGFYGDDILTNGVLEHVSAEDREHIEKELAEA